VSLHDLYEKAMCILQKLSYGISTFEAGYFRHYKKSAILDKESTEECCKMTFSPYHKALMVIPYKVREGEVIPA
jgi:hypothetical protein